MVVRRVAMLLPLLLLSMLPALFAPAFAIAVTGAGPVAGTVRTGGSWSIQESPNPGNANLANLGSVSCSIDGTCMAVGWYFKVGDLTRYTLAERWDGTRWSIEHTPSPKGAIGSLLADVACMAPNDCIAVGESFLQDRIVALVERWDGERWTRIAGPRQRGSFVVELNSVSCLQPADCVAVGAAAPADAAFQAKRRPLAEHWDGTSWEVQDTPDPGAPGGSSMDGVACSAPDACEAVGNYSYSGLPLRNSVFAMGWNGQDWVLQDQPNPGQLPKNYEFGVSCPSSSMCVSVGTWNATGRYHALAERWDGESWSRDRVPNPPGFRQAELDDVACPAVTACMAVGYWEKNKFGRGQAPLAERWDGARWSLEFPLTPPGGTGSFGGIDCMSPTACVAVGSRSTEGGSATLVEVYSG